MTAEDQFIRDVLATVPRGRRRVQIEMDVRAHLAERMENGQPVADALRQFGDPSVLAESYLASVPLVSASFVDRAVAKMLDFATLAVVSCPVLWLAWQRVSPPGTPMFPGIVHTTDAMIIAICAVIWCVAIGYFIGAEFLTDQTLGKRAMGIRVVRESGARIGLGQSFVRQLPLIGDFFFLDVLFALFTDNNQRAFELITKTRTVVDEDLPD